MRKYVAILLVMLFMLSAAGCSSIGKSIAGAIKEKASQEQEQKETGGSDDPAQDIQEDQVQEDGGSKPLLGGAGFNSPSESYSKYLEMKSAAFDRVNNKLSASEDTEIMMASMALLPVAMMDLSLIPLTALTADYANAGVALGILGMNGVKVDKNGDGYVITYTNSDGETFNQTCTYDKATDSLQSVLSSADGESVFFEYTRAGKGYASQTYLKGDDGYSLVKSYFDEDNIAAFGIESANSKPGSILGNGAGLNKDFVKNNEFYTVFENDQLIIVEKGVEKTA